MGDVLEFAGVVGVILVAALGWRWGNLWIQRLRGETAEELESLDERVTRLENALEQRGAPPRISAGDTETESSEM